MFICKKNVRIVIRYIFLIILFFMKFIGIYYVVVVLKEYRYCVNWIIGKKGIVYRNFYWLKKKLVYLNIIKGDRELEYN